VSLTCCQFFSRLEVVSIFWQLWQALCNLAGELDATSFEVVMRTQLQLFVQVVVHSQLLFWEILALIVTTHCGSS
jgi:hypothetical protein